MLITSRLSKDAQIATAACRTMSKSSMALTNLRAFVILLHPLQAPLVIAERNRWMLGDCGQPLAFRNDESLGFHTFLASPLPRRPCLIGIKNLRKASQLP
jgi:hypothetical protein